MYSTSRNCPETFPYLQFVLETPFPPSNNKRQIKVTTKIFQIRLGFRPTEEDFIFGGTIHARMKKSYFFPLVHYSHKAYRAALPSSRHPRKRHPQLPNIRTPRSPPQRKLHRTAGQQAADQDPGSPRFRSGSRRHPAAEWNG